jgi:sugar lactone lactonase YvrE
MPDTALNERLQRIGLLAALVVPMLTACGGGSSDSGEPPAPPPPPAPATAVSLLAGNPISDGNQDGASKNSASFSTQVAGMALGPSGEVVIADTGNNLIRKLSANQEQVSTLAGGTGPGAFNAPAAVAVDAAGNTYVADTGNHLVRKITPAGAVTTLAGQAGVCANQDGAGTSATLCSPSSIAVDKAGSVYVAEATGHIDRSGTDPALAGRIRKITANGTVSTLVGQASQSPSNMGYGVSAYKPVLLATDSAGTLYSADPNDKVIRKYTADGQATVVSGGTASVARFGDFRAITFDPADRLFVLDNQSSNLLGVLNQPSIRRVGSDGSVTTLVRTQGTCSPSTVRDLCQPFAMLAKADGQLLVAERSSGRDFLNPYLQLRSYTEQGTYTVAAGPVVSTGTNDAQGADARFDNPWSLAASPSGTLYVRDKGNGTIRTVQSDGVVRTLGQPGGQCASITGLSSELLSREFALATDGAGNLYTTIDSRILKLSKCEAVLLADLKPLMNRFLSNALTGIAADTAGNVYVSTYLGAIYKVDIKGTATLFAGTEGTVGHRDGTGQAAQFAWLGQMATDAAGNVYVVDGLYYSAKLGPTIRKITPEGVVTTLAGNPNAAPGHADGTGTAALFSVDWRESLKTASLAVDKNGNVYVSDPANSVIRKITPAGQVSTLVGQVGRKGFAAGDLPGVINRPGGIAIRDSVLYASIANAVIQVKLP